MVIHFDINDLKLVIHAAEMNSLTGAAGKVFLSLPAASARLRKFEDNIGSKIFERTTNGLRLTKTGEVVLRHSRLVNAQLERMCGELQDYVRGLRGTLRIHASTTAVLGVIPGLLPTYLAQNPDVDVEIIEKSNADIVRSIHDRPAEIGVVSGNEIIEGFETIPIGEDRLVFVCAARHKMVKKSNLDFVSALTCEHVCLSEDSDLSQLIQKNAEGAQLSFRVSSRVGDVRSACKIIEANGAVGIFPESLVFPYARDMKIHCASLVEEWARQQTSIVFRKPNTLPNFAKRFISMVVDEGRLEKAA